MDNIVVNNQQIIKSLSPELFWDTPRERIDPERNARWLIQRVLEYGMMSDWKGIRDYYGLERIKNEVTQMRSLEIRAIHFIASITNTPLEKFRCYILRQSMPKHMIF